MFPGSSEDDLHLSGFGQEELSRKWARPRPAGRRSPHTGQVCAAPMSTGGNVGVGICSQSCLRQRCVCVTVATLTCGGPTCTWTLPWREQAAAAPPAPAPPALREAPTSEVSLSVNSQKPDLNPRNPVWAPKQAFEGLSQCKRTVCNYPLELFCLNSHHHQGAAFY